RMEHLIGGILDYSRAGRASTSDAVDLGELFDEIRDAIDPPENLRLEIGSGLPTVPGDRTQLFQVFCNLVGNAVKYHDKASGRVTVRSSEHPDHWVITVEDDGPGIDPRYHDQVFQLFQTLQSRDERESTGVGLSIVRKIIERAGGRVWIESDGETGTAVHVRWPKRPTD
ncbi:MAG: HAMP domain-containing histidine kinase, partial [Acidobacteriota bacterium]|nr:HAMP domain-containing histidine kinase [Acidobacteriota bacterium]